MAKGRENQLGSFGGYVRADDFQELAGFRDGAGEAGGDWVHRGFAENQGIAGAGFVTRERGAEMDVRNAKAVVEVRAVDGVEMGGETGSERDEEVRKLLKTLATEVNLLHLIPP